MLNGRTRERNLDDPANAPIFAAAAALNAPLYLHPQTPVEPVRQAYYAGFDDILVGRFATAGVGWHYDTGVQLLPLILSGTFDRHPELQVIVGHWSELVVFYLERVAMLDEPAHLQRPILDYFRRNVLVTPSGIFSQRYLRWAIEVLGVERILFSVDYPYIPVEPGAAPAFLAQSGLAEREQALIAHGNWERLRNGIRR